MRQLIRPAALAGAIALLGLVGLTATSGVTASAATTVSHHHAARAAVPAQPSGAPYNEYLAPSCSSYSPTLAYGNSNYVMDAAGFGNPANAEVYYYNGGSNQEWCARELADGYYVISSFYPTGGNGSYNYMCLNVENASYTENTQIQVHQCDTEVAVSEQFYFSANITHGDLIYPAYSWYNGLDLCLNSSQGIGSGHHVILYSCAGFPPNEQWENPTF